MQDQRQDIDAENYGNHAEGKIPAIAPSDAKQKYLLSMIPDFGVREEYDGQMRELLQMGRTESHLWTVNI